MFKTRNPIEIVEIPMNFLFYHINMHVHVGYSITMVQVLYKRHSEVILELIPNTGHLHGSN